MSAPGCRIPVAKVAACCATVTMWPLYPIWPPLGLWILMKGFANARDIPSTCVRPWSSSRASPGAMLFVVEITPWGCYLKICPLCVACICIVARTGEKKVNKSKSNGGIHYICLSCRFIWPSGWKSRLRVLRLVQKALARFQVGSFILRKPQFVLFFKHTAVGTGPVLLSFCFTTAFH